MRKLLVSSMVLVALGMFGCAAGGMEQRHADKMDKEKLSKETHLVCPKCGVEFTVGEGLKEWEKLH